MKIPYVAYWMRSCHRFSDNASLVHAADIARRNNVALMVFAFLETGYPNETARHQAFMLQGLGDLLEQKNHQPFGFYLIEGSALEYIPLVLRDSTPLCIVTENCFLAHERQLVQSLGTRISVPLLTQGSDTVFPVESLYPKASWSAAVLRIAMNKRRPGIADFAEKIIPGSLVQAPAMDLPSLPLVGRERLEEVLAKAIAAAGEVPQHYTGGPRAARKVLIHFIETRLSDYGQGRMDPARAAVSHLSPYLHYGHIGPREISQEVLSWSDSEDSLERALARRNSDKRGFFNKAIPEDPVGAFLEELLVRRELAFNWAHYSSGSVRFDDLPAWAQKTLNDRRGDQRPYIYQREELETASTHDPVWNACQTELNRSGYMHGYLRMYWGKQILLWSQSPEEALATMEYLNNSLQLDGNDPNSLTGIMWCLGLHDRPWAERPVGGTTRSMTPGGIKKKFDCSSYLARWSP